MHTKNKLRLNIGGGKRNPRDYKNIDVRPEVNPDYLGDFREMEFENVISIRAHHILEHFSRKESIEVLKQWHSWLAPKGSLIIEVPDIESICKDFKGNEEKMNVCLYGSQEDEWAYHRNGWWEEKLIKTLESIGFKVIHCERKQPKPPYTYITVYAEKQ